MKRRGIISILLIFLFSQIQAQELKELQYSLDTAQSPSNRLEVLLQLAQLTREKNDYRTSLAFCAKAMQVNKNLRLRASFKKVRSIIDSIIISTLTYDAPLDTLQSIVNSLDKELITPDLLNRLTYSASKYANSEYSEQLALRTLNISLNSKDTLHQAIAYQRLGIIYDLKFKSLDAITNFKKAKTLFYSIKDTVGVISTIARVSQVYLFIYELDKAEKELKEGMALGEAFNNEGLALRVERVFFELLSVRGNYKEALQLGQSLYARAIKLGDEELIAFSSDDLSMIHRKIGNIKKAKRFFEKGLEYDLKYGYSHSLPRGYNIYGNCYKSLGIYDSAAISYLKSVQYAIDYDENSYLYYSLRELHEIHLNLQDTATALEYEQRLNDYFQKIDFSTNTRLQINLNKWEATKAQYTNQLDSAIYFIKKNLAITIANNSLDIVNEHRILLGELYQQSGNLEEAAQQFMEGLKLAQAIGQYEGQSKFLYRLAALTFAKGNLEEAFDYANQSFMVAEGFSHGLVLEKLYPLLSKIHAEKHNFKEAFIFQTKFDSLSNHQYGFVQKDRIAKYEAMFRMKEKELENEQMKIEQERKDHIIQQRTLWVIVLGVLILLTVLFSIWYTQQSKLNAQNKLRKQLTRDIHDEVGGILNNLKMNMEETLDKVPAELKIKDQLAQTLDLSNYATDSLENLIWKVEGKDSYLDKFEEEVKHFTQYYFSINKLPFRFETQGLSTPKKLPFLKYYHLSMIFKEALQNVLKHGNRKGVDIQWKYQEENLFLQVKNQIAATKREYGNDIHRGLTNMKERVASIKGQIEFKEIADFFILELKVKLQS